MASIAFQPTASPFVPGPSPSSATVTLDRGSFDILIRSAVRDWSEDCEADVSDDNDRHPAPEVQQPVHVESMPAQSAQSKGSLQIPKTAQRTLMITGLPESSTLADITRVVRGGPILGVHIRNSERCAFVSFVYENHAAGFFDYVRRFGLLINNKYVGTRWADRQYLLGSHTGHQIRGGATRNLVIRRCHSRHTDASIRDDLEHIHNLVAISVEFFDGNCYIKTNSVHNAIVARTCMMSRVKYKGSSIGWDVDECAEPIELPDRPARAPHFIAPPVTRPVVESENRFAPLRRDDNDNHESMLDDDQDSSESGFTPSEASGNTI
ncbi:uncharacterized protein B0I36DRAFT_403360 [Microdochium trichocladiopsis]|uniref:RRM domain-containing protein n=1 Tax=Microdochium trichocladiopsis TaxID=1682393 RepID=A0A9P8YBU1_9PEZI|nr:uncharacterized protein B0I36DRAFT_403360 [Microdochium trichocladiopsis]KAH7037846.1 hypothetical protein B0I36DRAFT_403360 [Microdochium trichocladiopsis]